VGRATGAVEIAVRDEDGTPLPHGQAGLIFVRGGQVSGEYLTQGSQLDAEGWFSTRDRGFLDADGYLFLDGRADDVIVRGGENISPGEIEDVLRTHPQVEDVAVLGVPDQQWGETVAAVIVARDGRPAAEDLARWVKDRLRSSKTPEVWEFRDALPYNDTGKLLRRQLKAELSKGPV
jgi:acyl-CoA synthetase (AMP-forming)/AMP-acid ligase II